MPFAVPPTWRSCFRNRRKMGELSRLIFDAVHDLQLLLKRLDVLARRPEAVYPYNPAWGVGEFEGSLGVSQ